MHLFSLFVFALTLCHIPLSSAGIFSPKIFVPKTNPRPAEYNPKQGGKGGGKSDQNNARKLCKGAKAAGLTTCGSSPSTSSTKPESTTSTATSTTTSTASSSDDGQCAGSDSACNYCAVAIEQFDNCTSFVSDAGLDDSYIIDCLCYEVDTTDDSDVWAPNYFDKAFASCPAYASTAAGYASSDIEELKSMTSLCSSAGDYYTAGVTDTGSFVIKAESTSFTRSSTGTPSRTSSITTSTSGGAGMRTSPGGEFMFPFIFFGIFF